MKPITRQEQLLDSIATGKSVELKPITREEQYLSAIAGLTDFVPEKPITRKEMFYQKILENGGAGGGTSEGVNLGYTLNIDGTYIPIDESKDSVFPSGVWYSKFVFVSDKIYTIDELLGCIITTKELYLGTGSGRPLTVENVEITSDLIMEIGNGTFAVMSNESPVLGVITESMKGVEIAEGFSLPTYAGTYLVYIDKNPDRQGYVFGSVSVNKPLGKPYIDTSLMVNFRGFCYEGTNLILLDKLDTSNGVNFSSMFEKGYSIRTIPPLDTSNGINFSSMFYQCYAIESIPLLDIRNGTNFDMTFNGCNVVKNIAITVAKTDLKTTTFGGCSALENLTIGEGWAVNIYVHYSNNLTVESLHGMIENLADLTGQTAKTFQIGATNLAKIDEEHIAMLQAKNWNYS